MHARRLKFTEALERKISRVEKYGVDVVGLNEDTREETVISKQRLGTSSLVAVNKRLASPGTEELVEALEGEYEGVRGEVDGTVSPHVEHDIAEHEEVVDPTPASGRDDQHTTEHSTQFEPVSTSSRGDQPARTSFLSNIFRHYSSHQRRDITPIRLQLMRKTQAGGPSSRTTLNTHQPISAPDLNPKPQISLGVPRRRLSKANRTRYTKDRRHGLLITGGPANLPQPEEHPLPPFKTKDDPTMRNTMANSVTSTYFIEEEG
ncbi:MAG: hypothetical protein LQ346_006264, partial [Caloplaca aetnensis]